MASWTNVVAAFLSPTMIVLLCVPSSFTRFSGSKACKHELVEVNWLEGQVGVRRRSHTPGGPREQDNYRSGRVSQGVGRDICVQRQPGIVIGSSVSLRRAPDRRQPRLLAPRSTRRPVEVSNLYEARGRAVGRRARRSCRSPPCTGSATYRPATARARRWRSARSTVGTPPPGLVGRGAPVADPGRVDATAARRRDEGASWAAVTARRVPAARQGWHGDGWSGVRAATSARDRA